MAFIKPTLYHWTPFQFVVYEWNDLLPCSRPRTFFSEREEWFSLIIFGHLQIIVLYPICRLCIEQPLLCSRLPACKNEYFRKAGTIFIKSTHTPFTDHVTLFNMLSMNRTSFCRAADSLHKNITLPIGPASTPLSDWARSAIPDVRDTLTNLSVADSLSPTP